MEDAGPALPSEGELLIAGQSRRIVRRSGSGARPLIRVEGIDDRTAAETLRGESVLVVGAREELGPDEWYDDDLVGCQVTGLGVVRAVLHAPSCDVLEVGDSGVLVPLIHDAVTRVDLAAREIEVDRAFLGLGDEAPST